jgi:proteic killer suppression protein
MNNFVTFTPKAQKQLAKLPRPILNGIKAWATEVGIHGIESVRLIKGYRDHPLKGNRKGQRSVSLNINWRLIYIEALKTIEVQEITHHDYRTN